MRKVAHVLPHEITDGYLIAAIIQSDAGVKLIQQELGQMYPDIELNSDQIRAILAHSVLQDTTLDGAGMLIAKAQVAEMDKATGVHQTSYREPVFKGRRAKA
jgi:hypothetical protein